VDSRGNGSGPERAAPTAPEKREAPWESGAAARETAAPSKTCRLSRTRGCPDAAGPDVPRVGSARIVSCEFDDANPDPYNFSGLRRTAKHWRLTMLRIDYCEVRTPLPQAIANKRLAGRGLENKNSTPVLDYENHNHSDPDSHGSHAHRNRRIHRRWGKRRVRALEPCAASRGPCRYPCCRRQRQLEPCAESCESCHETDR
jgi:hypothetical protein